MKANYGPEAVGNKVKSLLKEAHPKIVKKRRRGLKYRKRRT